MGSSRMPWKRQESCIWTQCFTKNVIRYGLDQVMFHSSTMRKSRYERPSPQLTSPVSTVTDLSPHFRFEKQIKTVQTWCFCTKKKNDWSWGLLMENLKYWLLIGRANLISTNGLSFTVCSQPFTFLGTFLSKLRLFWGLFWVLSPLSTFWALFLALFWAHFWTLFWWLFANSPK